MPLLRVTVETIQPGTLVSADFSVAEKLLTHKHKYHAVQLAEKPMIQTFHTHSEAR